MQNTGYKESRYERPTQKWVCGWAADGRACPMGPDAAGRCSAHAEGRCEPRKDGDRYFCSRPTLFGGPCEKGPLPDGSCCRPQPTHPVCRPRLSLRARRGRAALSLTVLAIGVATLLVTGPWRLSFILPGDLTAAHESVGGRSGFETCESCHSVAASEAVTWLAAAWSKAGAGAVGSRCMDCHFDEPAARETAHLAHGGLPRRSGSSTLPASMPPLDGITCVTCHREHRGRDHDLTHMDNTRCQTCHETKIDSFADDHPEFKPVVRTRAGIRYDHRTHSETHFGDNDLPCQRCHALDDERKTLRLEPFDQSCRGCHAGPGPGHHDEAIRSKKLRLLELPYMEFDEAEIYWPEDAARGEELTPLLLLLLAGDDEALDSLRDLDEEDIDWIPEDWWPDTDDPKVVLATGIKRVIRDLVTGDSAVLSARLGAALDADPEDPTVAGLVRELMTGSFALQAYQRRWLPGLAADLAGTGAQDEGDSGPEWKAYPDASGWYVSSRGATVGYRPTAHADPLFRTWIDALAAHADDADSETFRGGLRTAMFEGLTKRGTLYTACLRCHTAEKTVQAYRVNWRAAGRETRAAGYGTFDHGPHLVLLKGDRACRSCHPMAEANAEEETPHGVLPHKKIQCAGCHVPGRANADCLNCHVYHFRRP